MLDQKSAKSKHGDQKIHSEFSSCVNLINQKNIDKGMDKGKGLVMAASTIFDQFKNAQIPTKPPSICSKSNNERSTNNLLKNSQSLNEINPQQAHELLQKIYRHDPDKLKHLIREAQLQQTQSKRDGL